MTKRSFAAALGAFALAAALGAQTPPPGKQPEGPRPKTKAEYDALSKMLSATDPDARIQAGDEVISNFEKTEFKSFVFYTIASAYSDKKDDVKTIVYGDRALEADPKNYEAALLLARTIATKVRDNDLDREERLTQAEKYAKQALESIPSAIKMNANMTDEQWADAKKDMTAEAHQWLGVIAMNRKKYDVAVTEYTEAVNGAHTVDPAAIVRLAQADNKLGKYDDAIANTDKVMAMPNVAPAIKQFAQAERVRAFSAKQAAAPAK
jgi:tetratricopeptide (TPR) repeat protein